MLYKKFKNTSAVYSIYNLINGKMYIGSSHTVDGRLNSHLRMLEQKKHHSIKLQRAWNKYGPNNFEIIILEYCDPKDLVAREQYYIDGHDCVKNGYNICRNARSRLGVKQGPLSKEARAKISAFMKGRKKTNDHKKKLQVAVQKATLARLEKYKDGYINKGVPMKESTKEKLREQRKGKKLIGSHLEKVRAAQTVANAARWTDPEQRKRASEKMKQLWVEGKLNAQPKCS